MSTKNTTPGLTHEMALLSKLYECSDELLYILNDENDPQYLNLRKVISNLEIRISDKHDWSL